MLLVYGYSTDSACEACNKLKLLLTKHNMEYTFVVVEKGKHPFKTVPQSFFIPSGDYAGDYNQWVKILTR